MLNLDRRRAAAAALALIALTSQSTSTSAMFVVYRERWGLSAADIRLAFSIYIGTLLPVLLLFGGLSERVGRRAAIAAGMASMAMGTSILLVAPGLGLLLVARLLQGAGAAIAVGAISASFTEAYRGRIAAGQALAVVTAIALSAGPVITAIAYEIGGGIHASYLPVFVLAITTFATLPLFDVRPTRATVAQANEEMLPAPDVWSALRFAMPLVFVSWAANSLYLSLVPAYLAATLHATNPLIGALAFLATQVATIVASERYGNVPPLRSGVIAPCCVIVGLVVLIVGTERNAWILIAAATILVGAGTGVSSGASFAVANRAGRGQRARVFARLLVAAYLGYGCPALLTGILSARFSFTVGFIAVTAGLTCIVALLPLLRPRATLVHPMCELRVAEPTQFG